MLDLSGLLPNIINGKIESQLVNLLQTLECQQVSLPFYQDTGLRWLGHVAQMDDSRLHKKVLFGELLPKRPCHDGELWYHWISSVWKFLVYVVTGSSQVERSY